MDDDREIQDLSKTNSIIMTIPFTDEGGDNANDEKKHLQKSEVQIPTRCVKLYKNEKVVDCKVSFIQLENSELCCEVDSRSVTFVRKCESILVLWKSAFIIINHVFDFFTQLYHKVKFKSLLAKSESMELFDKRDSGIEWIFDFIVKPIRGIPQFIYKTFPLFPKDYKSFFEDGYKKQTLDSLKVEAVRLATFSTFPSSACAYATKLASAGFYYNGNGDEVVCFNCGMKHRNWRNRDLPLEIHKQMSPNCSFVLEAIQEQIEDHKNRGVPVNYATGACGTTCELLAPENKQSLNKYFENGETYAQPSTSVPDTKIPKSEEANPTESSHLNLPLQNSNRNVSGSSSRNDIQSLIRIPPTDITVNIATCYANGNIPNDLPSRNTIGNIPNDLPSRHLTRNESMVSKESMTMGVCIAKPKYPKYAIRATRLDSFNIWPRNMKQSPEEMALAGFFFTGIEDHCRCFFCGGGLKHWDPDDKPWIEHARWYQHCDFVRQCKGDKFIEDVQLNRLNTSPENEEIHRPSIARNCQTTNDDYMTHPAVQSVLECGYDPSLIKKAYDSFNMQSADITGTELLEAIFKLEEEKSTSGHLSERPNDQSGTNQSTSQKPTHSKGQTTNPDFELSIRSLEEENQNLRDHQTCKICLDEEISIVFLPCGHMAACAACAPALRKCPICRAFIKGTVKAIMC